MVKRVSGLNRVSSSLEQGDRGTKLGKSLGPFYKSVNRVHCQLMLTVNPVAMAKTPQIPSKGELSGDNLILQIQLFYRLLFILEQSFSRQFFQTSVDKFPFIIIFNALFTIVSMIFLEQKLFPKK